MDPEMHDAILEELLQLLDMELDSYRCLLDVLTQAQRLIIECRADELGVQMELQEKLLVALRDLDRDRATRVMQLAERLEVPDDDRTVSRMAQYLAEPYGGRLRAVASDLKPLLESIRVVNAENHFHLRGACGYMETTLKAIAEARAPKSAGLYGQRGHVGAKRSAAALSVNRQA
jgi:hypothetical protein